jgi:hypothetical protein
MACCGLFLSRERLVALLGEEEEEEECPSEVLSKLHKLLEKYKLYAEIHATKAQEAALEAGGGGEMQIYLRKERIRHLGLAAEYRQRADKVSSVHHLLRQALENKVMVQVLYSSSLRLDEVLKDGTDVRRIREVLEDQFERISDDSQMLSTPLEEEVECAILRASEAPLLPSPPLHLPSPSPGGAPKMLAGSLGAK